VTIAENGQMALHLPLTAARAGAFSTHTAHPEFVRLAEEIFSVILRYPFSFWNPYLYLTKAEVIKQLPEQLRSSMSKAVSCWRASRVTGFTHCGECVPCLVRRIALESIGVQLDEYERDLFALPVGDLPPEDRGKRNLIDLMLFVRQCALFDLANPASSVETFPDLVNPEVDLQEAMAMYHRFSGEAMAVFARHPSLAMLL
jgi:hypothetical protein